jgi:cytochrome c-type biogenesis protein CcmH/NrfF
MMTSILIGASPVVAVVVVCVVILYAIKKRGEANEKANKEEA